MRLIRSSSTFIFLLFHFLVKSENQDFESIIRLYTKEYNSLCKTNKNFKAKDEQLNKIKSEIHFNNENIKGATNYLDMIKNVKNSNDELYVRNVNDAMKLISDFNDRVKELKIKKK